MHASYRNSFMYVLHVYCMLQCRHCDTLQHTAPHCNTLQHTATHCTTLQHTAPHCNTLQHTATHCTYFMCIVLNVRLHTYKYVYIHGRARKGSPEAIQYKRPGYLRSLVSSNGTSDHSAECVLGQVYVCVSVRVCQ